MNRPQTVWTSDLSECVEMKKTPYMLVSDSSRIARLLWWALERMGALSPYMASVKTWTFIPSEQREISEAMMHILDTHSDWTGIRENKYTFIVGSGTFQKYTRSEEFKHHVTFNPEAAARGHTDYTGKTRYEYYGIPIHMIPHMTGMALVPKVVIEERKRQI